MAVAHGYGLYRCVMLQLGIVICYCNVKLHVVDNRAYTFTEMQGKVSILPTALAFWWVDSDRQGIRIAHCTGFRLARVRKKTSVLREPVVIPPEQLVRQR
jgi:hypothetical protein